MKNDISTLNSLGSQASKISDVVSSAIGSARVSTSVGGKSTVQTGDQFNIENVNLPNVKESQDFTRELNLAAGGLN